MKPKTRYVCSECGHHTPKWMGKCPGCDAWNTLEEETVTAAAPSRGPAPVATLRRLDELDVADLPRYRTRLPELDRVLGGGLVPGSLVLVAGDPGVGKSTLLLQAAAAYAEAGLRPLYVSAEESESQVVRRARRLGAAGAPIRVLCSTRLDAVAPAVESAECDVVIVDSIQTLHRSDSTSAPGSVTQVRDTALFFLELAKRTGVPVILVGHVTKEGHLAGPRTVEHMVDAVLYLEGDHLHQLRILRAAKNRFGATSETGVFTMTDGGLTEVGNPSELLLAERGAGQSGSAVIVTLEGTRPLLLEVQALVSGEGFPNPRRVTTGIDPKRLAVLLAVLERRAHVPVASSDVFVNVTGGLRAVEPAIDLGTLLAVASSHRDVPVPDDLVAIGEVGLGGEIRRVGQLARRLQEAAKLGFRRAAVPASAAGELRDLGLTLVPVGHVGEAVEKILAGVAPAIPVGRP